MGRHIKHLQPGQGIVSQGGHSLSMDSLGRQSIRIAHFRPQLGTSQGESLPLQGVQPRVEGSKRVRSCSRRYREGTVPSKVLHRVGGWVQGIQLGGLHLKARLHPLPELPLPDLPLPDLPLSELPLPDGGIHVVEAGHVIGQEGIRGVEGNKERVVAVGG